MTKEDTLYLMKMAARLGDLDGGQPYIVIAETLYKLAQLGQQGRRLAELQCNGYPVVEWQDGKKYEFNQLTSEQDEAINAKHDRLKAHAHALCVSLDLVLTETNRDPRGSYLRIMDAAGGEWRL